MINMLGLVLAYVAMATSRGPNCGRTRSDVIGCICLHRHLIYVVKRLGCLALGIEWKPPNQGSSTTLPHNRRKHYRLTFIYSLMTNDHIKIA